MMDGADDSCGKALTMVFTKIALLESTDADITHYDFRVAMSSKLQNKIRSKKSIAKPTIADVFGSVGHHEFLLRFIDMSYGER